MKKTNEPAAVTLMTKGDLNARANAVSNKARSTISSFSAWNGIARYFHAGFP
jgi:hypothetical protein